MLSHQSVEGVERYTPKSLSAIRIQASSVMADAKDQYSDSVNHLEAGGSVLVPWKPR
jgi:hypothetical protein